MSAADHTMLCVEPPTIPRKHDTPERKKNDTSRVKIPRRKWNSIVLSGVVWIKFSVFCLLVTFLKQWLPLTLKALCIIGSYKRNKSPKEKFHGFFFFVWVTVVIILQEVCFYGYNVSFCTSLYFTILYKLISYLPYP